MTLTAGSEIDAWCTSCRLNLNHRIVAMVGGAAKKVMCLTCNKSHNYRAPKTADEIKPKAAKKKAAAKKPAGRATISATTIMREWQEATSNRDPSEFLPYAMTSTFEPGQLVMHPKFGEGLVREELAPQKLSIVFKDGPKTLVHSRS